MHRNDYRQRKDIPAVQGDELREAMRLFASGVTIVTAEQDGVQYGITVSSFASVSLEPPTVMVCIYNQSSIAGTIIESEHFAVHILGEEQEILSNLFASSIPGEEKYEGLVISQGTSGAPLLDDALAVLDCVLTQTLAVGTHTVMFGRVVHAVTRPDNGWPLLYYNRAYRTLAHSEDTGNDTA